MHTHKMEPSQRSEHVAASSNLYRSGRARLDSVTINAELHEYNETTNTEESYIYIWIANMLCFIKVWLNRPVADIEETETISISEKVYICKRKAQSFGLYRLMQFTIFYLDISLLAKLS